MVRETRHLWVGNLPENIREDRIREHFKRYGRVQSVKIFSRKGGGECDSNGLVGCGSTGICATVSFMDIKSASKAHNNEHKLDEHLLTTEYHEPAAIPSAPPASAVPPSVSSGGSPVTQATPPSLRHPPPYSSPRFTHGPAEDITTFDRSSHFYERRDGTDNYVRRPPSAYHVVSPSDSLRGRTRERDRLYRNGPPHYTPILESVVARTPPTHHRTVTTTGWNSYESTSCSRYPSSVVTTPEILSYQEERRESTPVIIVHKKHPKSRRKCRVMRRCGSNGSESVSNNSDSSRSRSHSSSSSSHSRSSSSSSDSSSAAISERSCSTHSHHGSLKSTVTVHSTISTPLTNSSPVVHTDDRRPLAICVRNVPTRSSDSSLKDGLYHEYKKHGKVTTVKILGQGANRYAIVCFKKADDVEKALQVSHDKLFFGSKIEVTIYHGYDAEDNEFRPIEAELDEYHPKATRTLFIGNLEKDTNVNDLRNTFQKFGEIIDIDVKKQGVTCYAFCQYCDISSVVKAMHAMDGEYLGSNKINLGYGKSLATNCLWVAGVADCVTEKQLSGSFSQFGHVTHVDIDRSQGKALVFFQQISHAQAALSQMRGYVLKNRRLMADYASRECQENFYDSYEKSKSVLSTYENNCQDSPRSTGSTRGLDTPVSSTSSNSGNTNSKLNVNATISSNSSNSSSSNKLHSSSRYQHRSNSTVRTTPTHQSVQQTPSSNSASPIVNNTPSPSPSTSSRSTPRPQQTSRFDAECNSERRISSRSLEDLNIHMENGEKRTPPNPQDDVTLQKERVSLLEQLNDYSSSEDEEDEEELASATKQPNSSRQQRSTSREESRPGTPLCDERPENILAHYESRRAAKEKNATNTPLSLPLPSFANKVPRSSPERSSKSPHQSKSQLSGSSRPPSFDGARGTTLTYTRQSPPHAKDKPSILDSKLSSITSFDSLTETLKAPWIDQLKSLDEKYEKWSGSRSKVLSGKLDTSAIQTKHKLLDVNSIGRQRSEICQTVLSRKSVFDDHFKRLETITDQPPAAAAAATAAAAPTDFLFPRVTVNNTLVRSHSLVSTATTSLPNLCAKPPTINNASNVAGSGSGINSTSMLSPSSTSSSSSSVMKGLQYPFPSHPPTKPVAVTVAVTSSSAVSLTKSSSLPSTPALSTSATATASSILSSSALPITRSSSLPSTPAPPLTPVTPVIPAPTTTTVTTSSVMSTGSVTKSNPPEPTPTTTATAVITSPATPPLDDKKPPKNMLYNHVAGDEPISAKPEKKEDQKVAKEVKTENLDEKEITPSELKPNVLDEDDDDDSNDIDDNKTIMVKNKIIETVFHVKHEKKKSVADIEEERPLPTPVVKEKKKSSHHESKPKEDSRREEKPTKKDCIKTKEFNMFENKGLEKKKNHFLSEKSKSSDSEVKDEKPTTTTSKHKESGDSVVAEKSKLEKKNKYDSKTKHDYKKYKEHDSHKKNHVEKESTKLAVVEHSESEKNELKLSSNAQHKNNNKFTHEAISRKEAAERKNSSSSSSLSDSVHSKGKSSYDSVESNNDEKQRHDATGEHHKKNDKHKVNNVNDSGKEEKKGDRKKTEKTNAVSSKRKKSKKRKTPSDSSSDSEFESYDEAKANKKNHSIFEVVIDEPAYISMYDKVKARSTKNLQKQEEEKRQEKLKEKFNQLKQSRVKREEKKRSTSYEDDTDHERMIRKNNKLILDSSDEEHSSTDKVKAPSRVSDSSDYEKKKHTEDEEVTEKKLKKSVPRRSISGKSKEKTKNDVIRKNLEKILSDTSENESLTCRRFNKTKKCAIYSDSEPETKAEDKTTDELFYNLAELHHDFAKTENNSPPPLIDPMGYGIADYQKKKSHKKKQKRQKSREHSTERLKKHSKKERRKSVHSDVADEDKEHKIKQKKKKKSRNKVKSIENLEEDIFGSMSDDSDKMDSRKLSKLSVSDVYDADSDSSNKDVREEELLESKKPELEVKLLNSVENTNNYDNYFEHIKTKKKKRKKSKEEKSKHHHHHHHHHHNHHHNKHEEVPQPPPPSLSLPCLIEPLPLELGKEETKEEDDKSEDRHDEVVDIVTNSIAESHQERLHKKEETSVVEKRSPSPSVLEDAVHEKAVKSISPAVKTNEIHELAVKSIAEPVDTNIHERAVLSISSELHEKSAEAIVKEPVRVEEPKVTAAPPTVDDKTRITISQEETEDAIAAILGEPSEFGFDSCYPDEPIKPSTPGSEPDLQIDTDTEDNITEDAVSELIESVRSRESSPEPNTKTQVDEKTIAESAAAVECAQSKSEAGNISLKLVNEVISPSTEVIKPAEIKMSDYTPAKIPSAESIEKSLYPHSPPVYKLPNNVRLHHMVEMAKLTEAKLAASKSVAEEKVIIPVVATVVEERRRSYIECNGPTEGEHRDTVVKSEPLDEPKPDDAPPKLVEPPKLVKIESESTPVPIETPAKVVPKLESLDDSVIPVEKEDSTSQQKVTEEVADRPKEIDSPEVNEANKENIAKTVVNQENTSSELLEDAKLNVIVRNKEREIKEITKTTEEEIIKGVMNDFPTRYNHKLPENRNILEKVVQRIHESKRVFQKADEPPSADAKAAAETIAAANTNTEKVALVTEDEISSAKILLKMSETSVIKNKVTDYNCVIKTTSSLDEPVRKETLHEDKQEDAKEVVSKEVLNETVLKKNDLSASSASDLSQGIGEEVSEPADENQNTENSETKLVDHSYNAKRGRRRKAAAPGGVVTRRGKQNNVIKETAAAPESTKGNYKLKKPADVYEFKEDSEDEVKRPRLILTIKNQPEPSPSPPPVLEPPPPSPPSVAAPVSPAEEPAPILDSKPSPNTAATAPSAAPATPKSSSANTRKSRRLQEKDGVRNTVDDTIDEVIKSTANNLRPTRRTTRIAAAAAAAIITTVHESNRKNVRNNRKTPAKQESPTAQPGVGALSVLPVVEEKDELPESPDSTPPPAVSAASAVTSPTSLITPSGNASAEPTTLIDPVSGMLIPMKEAEEGQYVPVLTELNQSQKNAIPECPPEKKPRLDESVLESAISLVKPAAAIESVVKSSVTVAKVPVVTSTSVSAAVEVVAKPSVVVANTLIQPVAEIAATTSVIASVLTTAASVCKPVMANSAAASSPAPIPTPVVAPVPAHSKPVLVAIEDEPISLIKTSTPSIIPPAAAMKSHTTHSAPYNQTFPTMVYSQTPPIAKLPVSKTITSQPRVLTPVTPKAHIMQALNAENEAHVNDDVPYPPQYSSPLLHGAVASPPLGSPKLSAQPIVTAANTRVAHSLKNMVPLEPLKIDPAAGYYYMPNTSPQSRPAIAVQSPSPQPRVVHNTPSLGSGLLPHSAVQSAHYIHPQFMYQPYIQESSLTPYHIPPPSQSSTIIVGSAKVIPDRDLVESRQPNTLNIASPPLELRKKSSPHSRLSDSPLITSPYVQSNRNYCYDEPVQAHRPLPPRMRVSTPPYASKVPPQPGDPVDMYVAGNQSRMNLDTRHYGAPAIIQNENHPENELPIRGRTYTDGYTSQISIMETELDYSRRRGVLRSRDSSPSQMDSPPLGDSPPQGNLDGTVLVQMYPIIWQGLMALKNDQAAVQMHVISGNTSVAYDALPKLQDGYQPLLRIAQRMRLEQAQLEGVNRKMEIKNEHCTILGLPCGKNQEDVVQQATNLEACIIPYLQQKKAAGIINTAAPGTQQAAFVVHVFPPCEFADNVLLNAAPDLYRKVQETAYLVCIIVTV